MFNFKNVTIFLLSLLSFSVVAKDTPQMKAIAVWAGSFPGTEIVKYADYSEGVACYVYGPKYIQTKADYSGGTVNTSFLGDVGSISCVKVAKSRKK